MSRHRKVVVWGVLGLVVLAVGVFTSSASATTSHCLVINNALNKSYSSLQASVNGASGGATLWVRGMCVGSTTVSKNLTITGQRPAGFTAPTLAGGSSGTVVTINANVTVAINSVIVTHGLGGGALPNAGGILNLGTLTLTGVTVSGNSSVTTDPSFAQANGGGITNWFGALTLINSNVTNNSATATGTANGTVVAQSGGIYSLVGSLTLTNSTATSNTATTAGTGSSVGTQGGGIYAFAGSVSLTNATVTGNTAAGIGGVQGGGLITEFSTLTLNGTNTLCPNTPNDPPVTC